MHRRPKVTVRGAKSAVYSISEKGCRLLGSPRTTIRIVAACAVPKSSQLGSLARALS